MIQRLQALFPPTQLTVAELLEVEGWAVAPRSEPERDSAFGVWFAPAQAGPFQSEGSAMKLCGDALIPILAVIERKQLQLQGK